MSPIFVVSHHKAGGGKPLDSLWFSQESCGQQGYPLHFIWNGKRSSLLKLLPARRVIFDSIGALAFWYGPKLHALSKLLGKKIAVYWHETDWEVELGIEKCSKLYPAVQYALRDPKVAHFHVCQSGLEMLEKRYGVRSENLWLLPNISDSSRLLRHSIPTASDPDLFVACGRVKQRKGPDLFLDIAQKTIAHTPQAKFVWIGSFEPEGDFSEAAIAAEVRRLGLEQNVTFTGEMDDPTSIIAKASAFLLTSRDDPKPKVLMEALALGKPSIAFDVGGVCELLGPFGTVVPSNDVAAFCQALQALQQSPPLSEAAQRQQREWYLQNYSPEAFSNRFAQAVEWWSQR